MVTLVAIILVVFGILIGLAICSSSKHEPEMACARCGESIINEYYAEGTMTKSSSGAQLTVSNMLLCQSCVQEIFFPEKKDNATEG